MKTKITFLLLIMYSYSTYCQCFKSVYAGEFSTMAIGNDNSLWGWGSNVNRNLGFISTSPDSNEPTPVQVGTDLDWKEISIGLAHTLAIKNNGTLWAWGSNAYSQLGNGTSIDLSTPTQIGTATDWKSISTGSFSSFAIKNDGTLWAWGSNNFGQLALGDNSNRNIPTQVGTNTDWKLVEGGGLHLYAIKNNGTLWSSGDNRYGELGIGSQINTNTLTQVGTDTNWEKVSCISYHVLGLKNNGTLWGWGANVAWCLGMPNTSPFPFYVLSPTQIGANTDWIDIAAGEYHSLALKNNGTVWSAGSNYFGELGNGTGGSIGTYNQTFTQNSPAVFSNIYCGLYNSVAFNLEGDIYTWGNNQYGTKGNGIIDPPSILDNPYTGVENYSPFKVVCPASLNVEETPLSDFTITLYPNPASDYITINNNSDKAISNITIFDATGKMVLNFNENVNNINLKNLSAGIYFALINIDNQIIKKEIIKK